MCVWGEKKLKISFFLSFFFYIFNKYLTYLSTEILYYIFSDYTCGLGKLGQTKKKTLNKFFDWLPDAESCLFKKYSFWNERNSTHDFHTHTYRAKKKKTFQKTLTTKPTKPSKQTLNTIFFLNLKFYFVFFCYFRLSNGAKKTRN